MIQCLIAKFTMASIVRPANAVRMANAGHVSPFGQPGESSVRLFHLTYISSRHRPRLFDAYNISFFFKVLRLEKLTFAFLRSCLKSLHFLLFVSNAVVDNQKKFLKKM